jgi:hypothetical protein
MAAVPQKAVRRSVCAEASLRTELTVAMHTVVLMHALRLVSCFFTGCRRVPQPFNNHSRFSFAAPTELTSIQVNTPTYQLPELPAPDRPLVVPKQQQSAALPLLVSC